MIATTNVWNICNREHICNQHAPPPLLLIATTTEVQKNNNEEEEEEASKLLEIENGLRLVPRVKLNLTVYPSTPLTLSHPIDEWKMKRALIDFLHSSHSLTLPEDEDLQKRKRDNPEGALGRGRVEAAWCHSSRKGKELCSMEGGRREARYKECGFGSYGEGIYRCARSYYPVLVCSLFQLTEKLNEIELNLEGVKFKLARYYSCFGYFQGLKKDWEEHSTFRSRREPDTVVLSGMSSR
ncbi:hypothetical protein HKD37_07G020512 [Glycine soja]